MAVIDVKAALVAALSRLPDTTLVTCTTWPLLSQFRTRQPSISGYGAAEVVVKPDTFLSFRRKDADGIAEHYCFIEVDRGTESQRILAERATCYRTHYRSGGFAESRGGSRAQAEQYPFRVLAVFKTAERRNNAAERLLALNPPIKTMVWLTTMAEVLDGPLGAIWIRPADYHTAIAASHLELSTPHQLGKYRRQLERDTLLERAVRKRPLVGEDDSM